MSTFHQIYFHIINTLSMSAWLVLSLFPTMRIIHCHFYLLFLWVNFEDESFPLFLLSKNNFDLNFILRMNHGQSILFFSFCPEKSQLTLILRRSSKRRGCLALGLSSFNSSLLLQYLFNFIQHIFAPLQHFFNFDFCLIQKQCAATKN